MKDKILKKRVLSALLAAAMAVSLLPVPAAAESGMQAGRAETADSLAGKTISILGDSISTYTGVSDDASINATLKGGAIYYTPGRWDVYREDTWWQQAIDALDMELLVNNSWSGSCVLHTRSGTAGAYVSRCEQLHNDRTGEDPDIIAVFIAANDFSYYQDSLGTADIDYDRLIVEGDDGTAAYAEPATTCEAYAIMLHKMKVRYPHAEIYCMTPTARRDPDKDDGYADVGQPTAFNAELMEVMARFDCIPVDLEACGIDKEADVFDTYMADGRTHPNAEGMDLIAQALVSTMLGREAELHDVSGTYIGVDTNNGATAAVDGMGYTADLTMEDGHFDLQVTVTMGGMDITNDVYADGTIQIESVTGDIVIRAEAAREPMNFRWKFDGTQLNCVSDDENELTRLSGSVSDGMLVNTRYSVAKQVQLRHDEPWIVEWKASGSWSAVLLSAKSGANDNENTYLFKTVGINGFIGFGERRGGQSHNYGVELGALGIDTMQEHTYRIENRIAADGSNMAYLLVDGVDCGAMNHYFISGSNDQKMTVDWLSGRDFTFSYIGASGHTVNNCYLDYIAVWEGGADCQELSLRYDDRLDLSGKTVEIVDAGTPSSYQVGYGMKENAVPDTAVATLEGDTLVAAGIGTAKVRIDGTVHEVTVTAAPISLLLLIGQSNMEGNEGDASQSIVCPDGTVYATYGDRYDMVLENATHYAPSALTGPYRTVNAAGGTDGLSDYPVYMLTDEGDGRKGPDSGFAYEWVQQTGEKVWIVNAAHGGTSLEVWQPGTTQYEECQAMFEACAETLRKEIAAGHFTLSHMAYFWCQGCNDRTRTAEWYAGKYLSMHESLKTELAFDHDSDPSTAEKTFEFGGIIPVRVGSSAACYRDGANSDSNPYAYHESFVDLRMSGPRVAQYWMGNNPDLEDIWNVCTIGEDWVWMPDGTNGVSAYFNAHYPGGTVDYTTQVQQTASWYTPTTPKAVHDSIHYNQIGYNEVGRESVRNALIQMGINADYEEETTVEFVNWTGYQPVSEITASPTGQSGTLVVPIVTPITRCKDVTYTVSDGLDYRYYDLLADNAQVTGTLTAAGADGAAVNVVQQEPGALYADHLSQLPERLCRGVNLWAELEHDSLFYYGGTHWGVHGSGTVYSVTFPVRPGDVLYATAWGKAGENGHATSNGIRVTFFGEYGVVKTTDPAETYAEFAANGGYLVAPEGATAVNIPMWTNDDSHEIYILSRAHDQSAPLCSICGRDSHTHVFSDWETVTPPTETAQGVERRSCPCGETEERKVDGVWQKYALADHLMELPKTACCDTNLWAELDHDEQYFANGIHWGVHSSGQVHSLTLPVSGGDRIYASSFGAAGTNGSSSHGIRCTFFDTYGIAKTMTPAEVYAEFSANGYLTAPEGTVAVNVPMWTNSDAWEVYLLNREHHYTNGVCGGCRADAPTGSAKEDYKGKVISILSTSTSTFAGYIPTADGFNLEHRARYPQDNLLTDVNETWWMQVINELDAKLGINDSWAGSQVLNTMDGNSGDLGEDAALASLTRIQNLGANGTPDLILFYGGGNDIGRGVPLGSFDPKTAPTQVDMTATKWDCFADAYVAAIMRLQHFYPDTEIVVMMSHEMPSYVTAAKLDQYGPVMKAICEHYGVKYVDLRDCGVTFDMLPDRIHPNAEGMDCITADVLDTLLNSVHVDAGENVVCSVTHNLTNAGASLHYYKGVSEGASFVETITGKNVTVAVTISGEDVTAAVYKNGVISIPAVTGDLVISAKGAFTADGHLQQLPDNFCAGTNLWATLKPENTYYTVNGWGNTSEGTSWSITFPVEAGTRIWATSFGAYPGNGSSANGVRVTWFGENGLLETVSRDVVYAEFAANGYLTAPEGTVAMNLPMTHNREDYEVYLLSAGHSFGAWSEVTAPTCDAEGQDRRTCTACGGTQSRDTRISGDPNQILVSEPVEEGFFAEKVIMAIGDSLTAGTGVAAGQRYHDLTAQALGMTNINSGTSGAVLCPGGHLPNKFETLMTAELLKQRKVDVVTIFLGVNDWDNGVVNGTYQGKLKYDENLTYYDLGEFGTDDTTTVYGAAKMWCERILELQATEGCEQIQFVFMTPVITSYNKSVTAQKDWDQEKTNVFGYTLRQYCTAIMEVCAYYGVPVLDLNLYSGMYYHSEEDNNVDTFGGDGIHPGVNGHAMMADALVEFMLEGYHYETRTVPDCGHSYESAVTVPTCTEAGYTTFRCPACHYSYVDSHVDALGHEFADGICLRCKEEEATIPDGWLPVPISLEEESSHLAYKIENGVLTFHDFGDSAAEDYGCMPGYANTSVVETKYDITAWYQQRNDIKTVVFDKTISYIGAYTLTNMNQITEIRIENKNAELARNMVLFSTTDREASLRIYAASTVSTVESWIRGNNNRKLSAAVSDATMYYTDLEYLAEDLRVLEDTLLEDGEVDAVELCRALALLKDVPWNDYSISDYKMAIPGSEEILELLRDLSSGSCGDGLTYQLTTTEEEGKLNLTISGTGTMEAYDDPAQTPWYTAIDCISDITIGDGVTGIPNGVLPKDATYHVYLNSEAYTYAAENECAIQINTLRVLCIGNSHTADYSEFRSNILADMKNAGMETEVVFSRAMIGSIGLYSGRNSNVNATYRSHLEALCGQSGAYSNLKNNRYDLIIVQDYMESMVDEPEVFASGLAAFIQEVKSIAKENGNGEPQIAWFADWVDIRTTGGDNALYDGEGNKISLDKQSREQVYEKSLASITEVETAIARRSANMPDFVIHGSTIKQSAMSSYLGTTKLYDKNTCCLLERDTTHLTYELGRYLLGTGVLSEIVTHYGHILALGEKWTNVGAALTVENGPDASGSGSQYEGAVNEELLAIIREAISSPGEFRQSVYVTDPVDTFAQQLSAAQWNTEQVTDEGSALICVAEQVDAAIGGEVDAYTVELKEYDSPNQFAVMVQLRHGYSIREVEITIHHCEYKSVVTASTCTEQGYTTHTCTVCGDSYVDGYTEPTGEHSYSAGQCTVCGEDTVTASLDENTLTLTGELSDGTRILAACYDGKGKLIASSIFDWQGTPFTETIPAGETIKLFFTDENQLPLRTAIPLR